MRPYRSPINIPKTGHELVTCHYPLRIDTYSSCHHDCAYCYAKSMLTDRNLWNIDDVRVADLDQIKSKIERYLGNNGNGIVARAIRNRIPARLGGLTDCLQPIERQQQLTLQLIKYLNAIDYPYLIVTKSDLVSEPSYLREIRRDLAYVQITITTLDENTAKQLEPNAPLPESRIRALKDLVDAGIYCACRLSPIIPNITDEDCFEVIDRVEGIGVPHIIFELFRGNERIIKRVQDATHKKVTPIEKKGAYFRFRENERDQFYQRLARRMENSRTLFTFCSDGTPVPFSLHKTANCCGSDAIPRLIPTTKFNTGNQKVASNVYAELVKNKTLQIGDLADYFSLCDDVFYRFWSNGSLVEYIPNCEWDQSENIYVLK